MTAVVPDTDVVSLIFKGHSLSDKYLDAIDGKNVVLSFMTLAELELWTERRSGSGGAGSNSAAPTNTYGRWDTQAKLLRGNLGDTRRRSLLGSDPKTTKQNADRMKRASC